MSDQIGRNAHTLRAKALKHISECVSRGGYLMLITRLREELEAVGLMP